MDIERFSCNWTSRYGSVRTIGILVFVMPFKKNTGVDCIDLVDDSIVDIVNEKIELEVEVNPTCIASINVMIRS